MENRFVSTSLKVAELSSTHNAFTNRDSILGNISNTYNRSMISTSRSKNSPNGTNKSRIKVLPNYKPMSLNTSMPFISVFQCIEIQRLSEQIQIQRAKLNEAQKSAFNAINYQVQIQELSEKCTNMERQLKQYEQQLNKMNKICETLYHENQSIKSGSDRSIPNSNLFSNAKQTMKQHINYESQSQLFREQQRVKSLTIEVQKWANKFYEAQKSRQKQMQQIKNIMELQRQSRLERQIKDLQHRHQAEKANFALEIKRLTGQLENRDNQIQSLKVRARNSDDYIKQLQNYGSKLSQYEGKILLLSQQQMRLSRIVDNKSVQLNNARKKQFQLSQKLETDKDIVIDNNHLKQLLKLKERQLEDEKNNIFSLQNDASKCRQLYLLNQQLEAKNQYVRQQNERLIGFIRQKSNQVEKWKRMAIEEQDEISRLRQKQYDSVDKEGREKILKVQNERISNLLKVRSQQLQESKDKCKNLQSNNSSIAYSEKQYRSLEQKYKSQIEKCRKFQDYMDQLEKSSSQHHFCQLKHQQLESKLQFFEGEVENLRKQLSNSEAYVTQLKRNADRFTDNESLSKTKQFTEVQRLQQKAMILSKEVERLNELLKNKNHQINRLEGQKLRNYSISNECKKLESQLIQKQSSIQHLKTKWNSTQQKLYTCQSKLKLSQQSRNEYSKKITQLEEKQRKILDALKVQTRQKESMKIKNKKMDQELKQIESLQKVCQKQQNRITVYLRDLQILKKQKQQYQIQIHKEKQTSSELQIQIDNIINSQKTINKSYNKVSDQTGEISTLLTKTGNLQNTVLNLKQKYQNLLNLIEDNSSYSVSSNDIYASRVSTVISR